MMTTLDAPYWLRWAREYNEGIFGRDELRSYPGNSKEFKKKQKDIIPEEYRSENIPESLKEKKEIKYRDVPMVSFLISKLVLFFHQYEQYMMEVVVHIPGVVVHIPGVVDHILEVVADILEVVDILEVAVDILKVVVFVQ